MDPISIIGLVVNLAMAVGKLEHQAEVEVPRLSGARGGVGALVGARVTWVAAVRSPRPGRAGRGHSAADYMSSSRLSESSPISESPMQKSES